MRWTLPQAALAALPLALALAMAAGGTATDSPAPAGGKEILVLSTASNLGEVEPCGWSKSQKGGLARRAGLIDSLRAMSGEALVVDAGDITHPDLAHEERFNQFVFHAMGAMRYDAMTLGEIELYRGPDYVEAILDSTRAPVTVANARFTRSGRGLGERFLLREAGGVTYGIIGLIGQEFGGGPDKLRDLGFTIDDPLETAAELVPEVGKKADLVLVLAHLLQPEANKLVERVPGIDLVVLGHHPGTIPPTQIEGALVIRSGERGQFVAQTRVVVSPEHAILSYSGEVTALTIRDIAERHDLARDLGALVQGVNAERKRRDIAQELRTSGNRLVPGQDRFVGGLACARCHYDIYREWQETPHARAWESLVERHRDADPECISCHVTGPSQPGGYKGVGATQDMRNVQCESCHGMGTLHDMTGREDPDPGPPTCVRCHNSENSPEFDFDAYWPQVAH